MPRPALVLAFADPTRELRIAQEQRAVRDALRDREGIEGRRGESRWEVVERSNATLDDLRRAFADARGRVVGFHYAGHATGDRLLLEAPDGARADAHAQGLAAFLGAHRAGLQFVFLNACSTGGQVDALIGAGVPAVIATSRAIRDDLAIMLSTAFYQALAGGAGLRRAFEEATAFVRSAVGDAPRDAYRALDVADDDGAADRWPWALAVAPGAEAAEGWHLGAAVGDHTLGMPPLPPSDLPPTPYRRLLPFTAREARVFFGRGAVLHAVYDRVRDGSSAPVLLLHGQSGAGKSSLVDAGLRPRLAAEFDVRYARRDPDAGLAGTLRAAVGASPDESLDAAWRARSAAERPLVVILDQVEEAYTRGADGDGEVAALVGDLAALFGDPASRPPGRVILAFRKEWLPEIEAPLAAARLFYAKQFLARLDEDGVVEAVRGPARIPDYRLELADEEKLARRIAQDLLRDPDSPVAPTLQVLLTKMWAEASAGAPDVIEFDARLYRRARDGAALGAFLDEQLAALGADFPAAAASGLALDVLASHTTDLATARRREWDELAAAYPHAPELAALVARLVDLSLLADVPGVAGARMLAHDTLAPLVRRLHDRSVLPGQRARRVLEGRAGEWAGGAAGRALDDADLALVEAGRDGMRAWTADEARLVEASVARREADARAAAERAAAEVRRRRLTRVVSGALALLGLAAVVGGVTAWQAAARARDAALVAAATAQQDPTDGILLLATLDSVVDLPNALQSVADAAYRAPTRLVIDAGAPVRGAWISADGTRVLAVVADSGSGPVARVWNVDAPERSVTIGEPLSGSFEFYRSGDHRPTAALSPDGRRVAVVGRRGPLRVWNADGTGTPTEVDVCCGADSVWLDDGDARLVVFNYLTWHEWRASARGAPWIEVLQTPLPTASTPEPEVSPPAAAPLAASPAATPPRPRGRPRPRPGPSPTERSRTPGGRLRQTVPLVRPVAWRQAALPATGGATDAQPAAADSAPAPPPKPPRVGRAAVAWRGNLLLITELDGPPVARTLVADTSAAPIVEVRVGNRGEWVVARGGYRDRTVAWPVARGGAPLPLDLARPDSGSPLAHRVLAISADETRAAGLALSYDTLRVWTLDAREPRRVPPPKALGRVADGEFHVLPFALGFTRDGRHLVVHRGRSASRWSIDGATPNGEPLRRAEPVDDPMISADGRWILSELRFRETPDTLLLWSPVSGETIARRIEGIGDGWDAVLGRDGRSVLMVDDVNPVFTWGPPRWERRAVAPAADSVEAAVPSPDGRTVAAILRRPARLRLYATDGSGPRLTVRIPVGDSVEPTAIAFSPDGRRVAVGTRAGTVHVYVVDQAALLAYARRATNACLRVPLRRTYLGESADAARRAWEACERSHGRAPTIPSR